MRSARQTTGRSLYTLSFGQELPAGVAGLACPRTKENYVAKVESTVEIPLPPDQAWAKASDLELLPRWLTLHEGWRSPLPEQLSKGVKLTNVVSVKGMKNRVDWTIVDYNPPSKLALDGKGIAGTKYKITVSVAPSGAGTKMSLRADLGGPPLFGPVGMTVARALKGDISTSLNQFKALFAQ